MIRFFYSASAGGFFTDRHHGPHQVEVADPAWKRPRGPRGVGLKPPRIRIANPDCRIPADAVEISAVEHRALLDGEAAGQVIVAGAHGRPELADRPRPSAEQLWRALRRRRAGLLRESDWTQLPDVPAATRAAWAAYRQALRDLPAATVDPADVAWPKAPH